MPPGRHRPQSSDKERRRHATLTFGRTEVSHPRAQGGAHSGTPRAHRRQAVPKSGVGPCLSAAQRAARSRSRRAGVLRCRARGQSSPGRQIARASLARAIRYAEAHDLVGRNVATLVDAPKGQVGRPSRSLTLDQSLALLEAARGSRLNAYVVLSLTVGVRTEEARELRWDHVDLDGDPGAVRPVPPSVAVWRSVRQGGDTKTAKSRRTLALPQTAVQALREHRKRQAEDRLAAGALWQDHGLVFASASEHSWMQQTSDASSARSPKRPGSAQAGHHGTCVTPSSPS